MSAIRLAKWSLAVLLGSSVTLAAQEPLHKLYERGDYGAIAERAAEGRAGSPEDTYMAALAFLKTGDTGASAAEFRRLQESDDETWKQVGISGVAMLENRDGEAADAARNAAGMAGDNPYVQYQLGLATAGANDFNASAQAFARAAELKHDLAYAHYYAGQAFQKIHNLGKASEHYNYFMRLAPDSPDRMAVAAILRSMRK